MSKCIFIYPASQLNPFQTIDQVMSRLSNDIAAHKANVIELQPTTSANVTTETAPDENIYYEGPKA